MDKLFNIFCKYLKKKIIAMIYRSKYRIKF